MKSKNEIVKSKSEPFPIRHNVNPNKAIINLTITAIKLGGAREEQERSEGETME